jgi:hypothetical protein
MLIMFFHDNPEPSHFQAHAADFGGKMRLDDLSMIEVLGCMRGRDAQRLRTWATEHRVELWENGLRARQHRPLLRIGH